MTTSLFPAERVGASGSVSQALLLESLAPFRRSPDVPAPVQARVTGELPGWLRGDLLRTCPAVFAQGAWRAGHWFDGLGQLYAFRIAGSQVRFQSRLLDSEAAREIAAGRALSSTFGTATGRTPWQRLVQPVQRSTDNTNVNILRMGEDVVALTEGARQMRVDPLTLLAVGTMPYGPDELMGTLMGAHPHRDPARDTIVNLATRFGATGGAISVYEHGTRARVRRRVGTWRTDRVPYMHSFGLTPTQAVLVAHPFAVKPRDMLWSNRGYIDHFEWRPREGTRLIRLRREDGAASEHEADAMFVFHTVNAFERADETVLDVLAYTDAGIMDALRVPRMAEQLPDLRPRLVRITMRQGRSRAELQTIGDLGFEFPGIHERRAAGRDYRWAWGTANGLQDGAYASRLVKVDVTDGRSTVYGDGDHIFGEPVFVGRPGGIEEDDGVLLAVGCSRRTRASVLAVIDARAMALVASAQVDASIPLGFHGSFLPAREVAPCRSHPRSQP